MGIQMGPTREWKRHFQTHPLSMARPDHRDQLAQLEHPPILMPQHADLHSHHTSRCLTGIDRAQHHVLDKIRTLRISRKTSYTDSEYSRTSHRNTFLSLIHRV